MKLIQFLALFFFSLVVCGQSSPTNEVIETKANWKSLNETDYSIKYPENWELNTSGMMGMSFILLSKQTSSQDNFRENVNLLVQDLTGQNINLDKYVKISEGQIKTMITNGNLIESKRQIVNELEFQKVIYTGDQGIYNLKFEQYYWIKKEKAYVLTLTCKIDQFDQYKETGEKILKSFILK